MEGVALQEMHPLPALLRASEVDGAWRFRITKRPTQQARATAKKKPHLDQIDQAWGLWEMQQQGVKPWVALAWERL